MGDEEPTSISSGQEVMGKFFSSEMEEWLTYLNDLCVRYEVNPHMALRRRHIKKMFFDHLDPTDDWREVLESKIKKIGKEKT